jgi:glycine betaine catabolism A
MTDATQAKTSFVKTLPGRYYYESTIYEQELAHIFSEMWVCVARVERLFEIGMYRVVTVGTESVLVIRDRDGSLRAFLNVCRHRGARLCTTASGQLKGSVQCRYHAWTYGLDGRLLGAPNLRDMVGFDRATYGLLPVALEVWEGLIWLNLAPEPGSFAAQVHAPILERFGTLEPFQRYHLGDLQSGTSISYDVKANWKLVLENFLECYHCGPMHPEFCDLLPGFQSGQIYTGDESATLAAGKEAFSMSGKASRSPLPGLSDAQVRSYSGIVIPPNVLLNFLPDHLVMHTLFPTGPTTCQVNCEWLFAADEVVRPDFHPQDTVDIFDLVNRQDWEICELTQLGMSSRAYASGGVYVPAEAHIRELADFILGRLA